MSLAPLKLWKNNLVHYIYFCLKQGLMLPRQASNFNSVVKHLPAMLEGLGCSHIIGGKKKPEKVLFCLFTIYEIFLYVRFFIVNWPQLKNENKS